jgi:secreted protein with Ig-like and vWFA domain
VAGEKVCGPPGLALVLAVDRSGSMAGAKLESAKEGARRLAAALAGDDLFGLVAYDSEPVMLVRLQKAEQRARIDEGIGQLAAGGGTNIYPALQTAYETLAAVAAGARHVILVSDGQAAYDGIEALVDAMHAEGITVSTVALGDADMILMKLITEHGGGRLRRARQAAELPDILLEELEAMRAPLRPRP